jgi:hypothetical protein
MGSRVIVEGYAESASLTSAHNSLNLELAGGLLVWVPPGIYAQLQQSIDENPARRFAGCTIAASGVLANYGGRRNDWKGRLQVTLDDPKQLWIVDDATAGAAQTTQPAMSRP